VLRLATTIINLHYNLGAVETNVVDEKMFREISSTEKAFIRQSCAQNIRCDGRYLNPD
jgi:hypothetical protein